MSIREDWEAIPHHVRAWITVAFWIGVAVLVAVGAWSEYHHQIVNFALAVLIIVGGIVDETGWPFWIITLAALVWVYAYRQNRKRQEKIIEILMEIYRKLE